MKVLDAKDYDLAYIICSGQKQPLEVFYKSTVRNIHWKTPVLESLFFLKKRFQHRCFPVKFLGTSVLKNIREWLLLNGKESVFILYLTYG